MPKKVIAKRILEFGVTRNFLRNLGGDGAVALVKVCAGKSKPLTDEEIGKGLKLKITEIRAILNRLHFRGIASYDRTRNMKTGWYTYKWDIKPKRIAELILENQAERLEKLETRKSFESNYVFFSCDKECNLFPFEVAAEYEFKCPECGNTMETLDGKKRMQGIENQIKSVNSEIRDLAKFIKS